MAASTLQSRRRLLPVFLVMFSHVFTLADCVDTMHLSFLQSDRAYFIKPLSASTQTSNLLQFRQQFAITHPSPFNAIKINYGPFQTQTPVSRHFLPATFLNGTPTNEVPDIDISAHIVSDLVTPDQPSVQVLGHAGPIRTSNWVPISREKQSTDYLSQKWCLQVHAQFNLQRSTSVCVLGGKHKTCTVDVPIPEAWWNDPYYHRADMFYSFYPITINSQCSSASTLMKSHSHKEDMKRFYIGEVTLDQGTTMYRELRQDQHVLIYVPNQPVTPKSKFMGKVKLQAESNVKRFSVRIRTRSGVKVMDVLARNPSKWKLEVETSKKKQIATVTASVRNEDQYVKSPTIQDVFDWVFEVEDYMHTSDSSRIIWRVQYEPSGEVTTGPMAQVRASSRIMIDRRERYNIVPVLKVYEILNMAMLTGKRMSWPLEIYAVRPSGLADDISKLSQCWSTDVHIIKIAADCNQMYLDGSETTGSTNVSFTVRHADQISTVALSVWVPEIPLGVSVSDSKLSQIKGWKSPDPHLSRKTRSAENADVEHVDGKATSGDDASNDVDDTACRIRYQQATVQVYTRFTLMDNGRVRYWLNRKAQLEITDFLKDRLRVSDPRIARLDGVIVEGQDKGRTEVQVVSTGGRVIGAREVRVSTDKVEVTKLEAVVVSGLGVEVAGPGELAGTYRIGVLMEEKLRARGQEGFLDINIQFNDNTATPLYYINPNDYFLEMDTQAPNIVTFGPLMTADRPRVKAVGQGKGVLKLSLELGDTCRRKASTPLASSEVYVDVDFSAGGPGLWMNDGHWFENLPPAQWHVKPVPGKEGIMRMHFGPNPLSTPKPKVKSSAPALHGGPPDLSELNTDVTDFVNKAPDNHVGFREAQKQNQNVHVVSAVTPLQIGIYALIAIVCPAAFVMTSYCVVTVVRRQKRQQTRGADTVAAANDWVWIGRATLERNRVNTECSQALMPAADFNGNQTSTPAGGAAALSGAINESSANNNDNNRLSLCSHGRSSAGTTRTNSTRHSARHSAVPITNNAAGASSTESSNRSSTVSEYQGEEVNIRITTNPIASNPLSSNSRLSNLYSNNNGSPPTSSSRSCDDVGWDCRAMGLDYDELMDYFDNLKESTA